MQWNGLTFQDYCVERFMFFNLFTFTLTLQIIILLGLKFFTVEKLKIIFEHWVFGNKNFLVLPNNKLYCNFEFIVQLN